MLNTKQNTLIPGNGIVIEGNVISSTGGGESGGSIDLSSYAKKTDVETALAGKQDVISDLADIKEGASKGKTALQSYNETDPVYTADKPSLALKSELATKQNKLTAGNGISIEDNKIGVTAITESESQPSTHLWINPSEDAETGVTYNRSQIDALVGAKQDTLQLTVKDNGNIVLANIQGQSKEFMPATPSGDPMHWAYVAAGAEYNDTGADITKTAPWADMVDDKADAIVTHKAGYWYLNGLGDLSNVEIRKIVMFGITNSKFLVGFLQLPVRSASIIGNSSYVSPEIKAISFINHTLQSIDFNNNQVRSADYAFYNNTELFYITNLYGKELKTIKNGFVGTSKLKYIKYRTLLISVDFRDCPLLTSQSILYMINNEAATTNITITLHADAYARAMANADIVAALEAHPNVHLAPQKNTKI